MALWIGSPKWTIGCVNWMGFRFIEKVVGGGFRRLSICSVDLSIQFNGSIKRKFIFTFLRHQNLLIFEQHHT